MSRVPSMTGPGAFLARHRRVPAAPRDPALSRPDGFPQPRASGDPVSDHGVAERRLPTTGDVRLGRISRDRSCPSWQNCDIVCIFPGCRLRWPPRLPANWGFAARGARSAACPGKDAHTTEKRPKRQGPRAAETAGPTAMHPRRTQVTACRPPSRPRISSGSTGNSGLPTMSRSSTAISASLPGSSVPVSSARPQAAADPRV